ncbi:hypothetical protein M514_00672, partial [Trichuris suis]
LHLEHHELPTAEVAQFRNDTPLVPTTLRCDLFYCLQEKYTQYIIYIFYEMLTLTDDNSVVGQNYFYFNYLPKKALNDVATIQQHVMGLVMRFQLASALIQLDFLITGSRRHLLTTSRMLQRCFGPLVFSCITAQRMSLIQRHKYEAGFKLRVVEVAKEKGNCYAARQFDVHEKMVREWRKNEEVLKKLPSRKCALRGRTPSWPDLENHVAEWVNEQRRNGHMVTRNAIRSKAMEWANKNAHLCLGFNATAGWCSRFIKRKDLVLRLKTKSGTENARPLGS